MAKKTTRSARGKSRPTTTVGDVCAALQQIAPLELAQGWDNVGLLAGDRTAPVRRMLLCIDLTPPVAREAVRGRYDLVMAYHPADLQTRAPLDRTGCGTGVGGVSMHHRGDRGVFHPYRA
jgi:hypothetical protein